jgi:hypothetical protein
MAQPTPPLYALDPALPVLLRPDGAVQRCCPTTWSPTREMLRELHSQGVAHLAVRVPACWRHIPNAFGICMKAGSSLREALTASRHLFGSVDNSIADGGGGHEMPFGGT